MATPNFKHEGAVTILVGSIANPDQTTSPHLEIQCQGAFEQYAKTREGLAAIHNLLQQGLAAVATAMISTPSAAEAGKPQVIHATNLPTTAARH